MENFTKLVYGFLNIISLGFIENPTMFQSLLNFLSPIASIRTIEVKVNPNKITFSHGNSTQITYQKQENGCLITTEKWYGTFQKFSENQNFITIFSEDFEEIMEKIEDLDYFRFIFHYDMEELSRNFLQNFEKTLKHRPPIPVKFLHLEVFCQKDILSILPNFSPEAIFIIDASRRFKLLETDEILKLNQWKNAKELEIWRFYVHGDIKDFVHFMKAIVDFQPSFG